MASSVALPVTFFIPFPIGIKTAAATSSGGPARGLSFVQRATPGSMVKVMLFMRAFTGIQIAGQPETARWMLIRFNVSNVTTDILTDLLALMRPAKAAALPGGRTILSVFHLRRFQPETPKNSISPALSLKTYGFLTAK